MKNIGVCSTGIKLPILRNGDNLKQILIDTLIENGAMVSLKDGDVLGITESLVARTQGNYVTVDEVAEETKRLFGENANIILTNPIYSRNRFSMILKGIARGAKVLHIVMPPFDEVGNPSGVNPFTGVDIAKYYREICEAENCEVSFSEEVRTNISSEEVLDCRLRPDNPNHMTKDLSDFFHDKCEYGLLGSNKASEEELKLFPNREKAQKLCDDVKAAIKEITNKNVIVCVYGDGCFKDPVGGIWEFADPVTMPAYTDSNILESTPNEIKLKYIIDTKEHVEDINSVIRLNKSNRFTLNKTMAAEGTTPRIYRDLLASLMDLTSGSGDRGTPVVLIQNYFTNYVD